MIGKINEKLPNIGKTGEGNLPMFGKNGANLPNIGKNGFFEGFWPQNGQKGPKNDKKSHAKPPRREEMVLNGPKTAKKRRKGEQISREGRKVRKGGRGGG